MKKILSIFASVVMTLFIATGAMAIGGGSSFNPTFWILDGTTVKTASDAWSVEMGDVNIIGNITGVLEIANDTWFRAINNAGTGVVNMFKVNTSDLIEFGASVLFPNDTWIAGRNQADDANVNMFKVNVDDEIEVGATLITGSFEFNEDSGVATAIDMPVSATPVAGTEESYTFKIDGTNIMKVYAEADSSGGIQNSGISLLTLIQEDVGATCSVGEIRFDTGGATDELCYCSATDTWKCVALGAITD